MSLDFPSCQAFFIDPYEKNHDRPDSVGDYLDRQTDDKRKKDKRKTIFQKTKEIQILQLIKHSIASLKNGCMDLRHYILSSDQCLSNKTTIVSYVHEPGCIMAFED